MGLWSAAFQARRPARPGPRRVLATPRPPRGRMLGCACRRPRRRSSSCSPGGVRSCPPAASSPRRRNYTVARLAAEDWI